MGVEILKDEYLAGKVSSDAFANFVQEVPKRGQAAVRGNVNVRHCYSSSLGRDIAAAKVKQDAGGTQR